MKAHDLHVKNMRKKVSLFALCCSKVIPAEMSFPRHRIARWMPVLVSVRLDIAQASPSPSVFSEQTKMRHSIRLLVCSMP